MSRALRPPDSALCRARVVPGARINVPPHVPQIGRSWSVQSGIGFALWSVLDKCRRSDDTAETTTPPCRTRPSPGWRGGLEPEPQRRGPDLSGHAQLGALLGFPGAHRRGRSPSPQSEHRRCSPRGDASPLSVEFPLFVAVTAPPLAGGVAALVLKTHGDPILGERPEVLPQRVIEFAVPFAAEELDDLTTPVHELVAIPPSRVLRVRGGHPLGISAYSTRPRPPGPYDGRSPR